MVINIGADLDAALINGEFATLLTAYSGVSTIDTAQSTTSTGYTDLATAGPAVTLTSVGTRALVFFSFRGFEGGTTTTVDIGAMSVTVSGATTLAASDSFALMLNGANTTSGGGSGVQGGMLVPITITPGSNTFTAKYRSVNGVTYNFASRKITVFAP